VSRASCRELVCIGCSVTVLNLGAPKADTQPMPHRAHRSAGLNRSLTLLWTFVLASGAILAAGALVLSSLLGQSFREQILEDTAREGRFFSASVLTPLVRGDRIVVTPGARRRLVRAVRDTEFTSIAVWTRGGRLLYSTPGVRRPTASRAEAAAVARTRRAYADVTTVTTGRGREQQSERALEVWSPIRSSNGGRPAGVVRALIGPHVLDASLAETTRTTWIAVIAVFGILWLALIVLVRSAASRLSRQNDALEQRSRELSESSRRVEENLLETIETLNAAVEARDPYTAGHSQRVRHVTLAIGRELALPAPQLGALGTAALFHDVGKIGIPDSILTKSGPLEPAEAAIMREHVTRGAEIVSKVSSFQDAVPAIRYHHERWDGLGYPEGLSGDEIPLEAAIVGLADAWDAMTTDRPYAHGLSLNEAMLQIRSGRGKQFSPVVVDAFWNVARRRPGDVLPPEVPSGAVVAV
jgi:putative nucleotidyltransferase with HDIG domain